MVQVERRVRGGGSHKLGDHGLGAGRGRRQPVPFAGRLLRRFRCHGRGRHHGGRGLGFTAATTAAGQLLVTDVGQTADFQRLGDAQQRSDLLLVHVDLTFVHEVDDGPELRPLHVLEYDDRVLALVLGQHALEVRAARGQHDLVRLERVPVAGDGHVHERAVLQQLVEHVGQVALVVIPSQAELLVAGTAGRGAAAAARAASLVRGRRVFGPVARLHGFGGRDGARRAAVLRCRCPPAGIARGRNNRKPMKLVYNIWVGTPRPSGR